MHFACSTHAQPRRRQHTAMAVDSGNGKRVCGVRRPTCSVPVLRDTLQGNASAECGVPTCSVPVLRDTLSHSPLVW